MVAAQKSEDNCFEDQSHEFKYSAFLIRHYVFYPDGTCNYDTWGTQ